MQPSLEQDPRAVEIEAEAQFLEPGVGHGPAQLSAILRVEHEEAAAPAPTSFPPMAPLARASAYHASILGFDMAPDRRFLISQCSWKISPSSEQRPASRARWLRSPSSLTKCRLSMTAASSFFVREFLILQDGAGTAIEPGEKQRQVVLEVEEGLAAQLERGHATSSLRWNWKQVIPP